MKVAVKLEWFTSVDLQRSIQATVSTCAFFALSATTK